MLANRIKSLAMGYKYVSSAAKSRCFYETRLVSSPQSLQVLLLFGLSAHPGPIAYKLSAKLSWAIYHWNVRRSVVVSILGEPGLSRNLHLRLAHLVTLTMTSASVWQRHLSVSLAADDDKSHHFDEISLAGNAVQTFQRAADIYEKLHALLVLSHNVARWSTGYRNNMTNCHILTCP